MNFIGLFLFTLLFLSILSIPMVIGQPLDEPKLVLILRSTYPDQQKFVDVYKPYLSDSDYVVTFLGAKNLDYAEKLPGSKAATYSSVSDIDNAVESLKERINYIAYDIEKELSPQSDLDDPVLAVKTASEIVHSNGMEFMLAPSGKITDIHGEDFAPYVDVYILQYQAYQKEPSLYESKVISMAEKLRSANPSISIITQVSTLRGSTQNMIDTYQSVADHVDGVTIFYGLSENDFSMMVEFLEFSSQLRVPEIKIPDWVRNNAGWWSEGLITDKDFASGIQFLIESGIIQV